MRLKQTDVWYVDSEEEAVAMIDDYKDKQITEGYTVTKSGYKAKIKKSKGEIVDMHYEVEIARAFDI